MGWIPCWVGHWVAFLSDSAPFLSIHFLWTGTILGQKIWQSVGNPFPTLEALSPGGGLFEFPFPTVGILAKVIPHWVLKVSHPQGLWYFLEGPLIPLSRECIFPFVLLTLWGSLLPHHTHTWPCSLPPTPLHSNHVPPSVSSDYSVTTSYLLLKHPPCLWQ